MKSPKYHLFFSVEEYRLLFNSLVKLKNRLHCEDRYTDSVDKLLIKISKAKRRKICIV